MFGSSKKSLRQSNFLALLFYTVGKMFKPSRGGKMLRGGDLTFKEPLFNLRTVLLPYYPFQSCIFDTNIQPRSLSVSLFLSDCLMSTFHKPKVFRSSVGCCICRAKSSSSRFTDSARYSEQFQSCFKLAEDRVGEICNACVLLVKRFRKLPTGHSQHWAHVVDARQPQHITR